MGQSLSERQLAASARCVDAILEAGSTRLSIEVLRQAAGVSKRTFHRYFPYKAQAIRPHYAVMLTKFTDGLMDTELPSIETLTAAWVDAVIGPDTDRTLQLFRLIRADPEFWSVFLEVVQDGERSLSRSLQTCAGAESIPATGSVTADVAAVGIVASSRLALSAAADGDVDPAGAFHRYLRGFGRGASLVAASSSGGDL